MIALKILAVWLIVGFLVALSLGRFLKATEPQEHARIKNASGSSANGDDSMLHGEIFK